MKIAISTESSADCTKALAQLHQIAIIPFTVNKGLTSIKDGDETLEQLFAYVEETGKLPKTSAINTYEFQNHFGNLLCFICIDFCLCSSFLHFSDLRFIGIKLTLNISNLNYLIFTANTELHFCDLISINNLLNKIRILCLQLRNRNSL